MSLSILIGDLDQSHAAAERQRACRSGDKKRFSELDGKTAHAAFACHAADKIEGIAFIAALTAYFDSTSGVFARSIIVRPDAKTIIGDRLYVHGAERKFRNVCAFDYLVDFQRTLRVIAAIVKKTIGQIAVTREGAGNGAVTLAAMDDTGGCMQEITISLCDVSEKMFPVLLTDLFGKFFARCAEVAEKPPFFCPVPLDIPRISLYIEPRGTRYIVRQGPEKGRRT